MPKDITESTRLQEQFQQAQRLESVGRLAGGVAHDFNNLLTIILGNLDRLTDRLDARNGGSHDADAHRLATAACRAAERGALLTRRLLAFSRRQPLEPIPVDPNKLVASMSELLRRTLGEGIAIETILAGGIWRTLADPNQLENAILNLAVNARDAMPGGGDLTVRTRNVTADECKSFAYRELTPADYVLVDVEDTGSGIAPDVLKKIFEPFFTTKEVGKGTGLGLSMVYGIIKQTGGFIFCDSEVGKGTVFRIFLPRHIAEAKKQAEPGEAAATTAAPAKPADTAKDLSGSATVLLVEDEDAVRMGGVRALTSRGYTVHEASSGVEALEVFEALGGKVDIVVSDVVMPEMDGPTLLGELRKRQSDIKFVFVSGYAEDAFARNLPADAHFGFLPKPFSLKQLATIVKDVLES